MAAHKANVTVDCSRPVRGVRIASANAGLRYGSRTDVALFELAPDTVVSGVFTRNRFKAAPVVIAERHLSECAPRYLLINAGYANAGLGEPGIKDAMDCCGVLARQAGVNVCEVLPFSTGVIGERMPAEKIVACLPKLLEDLSETGWFDAADAIRTTDAFPKTAGIEADCAPGNDVFITGIAKGAGMICPNMATMLAFVGTDVEISRNGLDALLIEACADSFNRITVDGETSTNDACVLFATGRSGVCFDELDEAAQQRFRQSLKKVMCKLAEEIVRDGEGAKHLVKISVERAFDKTAAETVAYAVAHSPLVKTALAAADPNWGRVLGAVGRAGVDIDIKRVALYFGDVCVFRDGALNPEYTEEQGLAALSKTAISTGALDSEDMEAGRLALLSETGSSIRIVLNSGTESAVVLTSDLTEEYVRINADYRS